MKAIIGFILIIAGIVVFLFFSKYSGDSIPYPFLWYLISIAVIGFGILLILNSLKVGNEQNDKTIDDEIDRLKKNGDKITVDLNICEIVTNNYVEERESNSSYRVQAWDALYDSSRNVELVSVNQTVLLFETDRHGNKERFRSPTISKDEITLKFLLDRQQETFIYVDRDNRERYYFDLEFLIEKE